jgi:hypothetical protein
MGLHVIFLFSYMPFCTRIILMISCAAMSLITRR